MALCTLRLGKCNDLEWGDGAGPHPTSGSGSVALGHCASSSQGRERGPAGWRGARLPGSGPQRALGPYPAGRRGQDLLVTECRVTQPGGPVQAHVSWPLRCSPSPAAPPWGQGRRSPLPCLARPHLGPAPSPPVATPRLPVPWHKLQNSGVRQHGAGPPRRGALAVTSAQPRARPRSLLGQVTLNSRLLPRSSPRCRCGSWHEAWTAVWRAAARHRGPVE